ncbi:MAG: plastocyanin/azurin family copper-binding protein [Actinomycetota bacterium]
MRTARMLTLVAVLSVVAVSCGGKTTGTPGTSPTPSVVSSSHADAPTVAVKDNVFEPAELTVAVGTMVMWKWEGSLPHTVTADDKLFDSGDAAQTTGTFMYTFDKAGTYPYYCVVHGKVMAGKIIVS